MRTIPSENNSNENNFITWAIYPFTMISATLLFLLFKSVGSNFLLSTYIPLLFSSVLIFLLERSRTYNPGWKPQANDWFTDSIYFVLIQSLLSKALVWLSIHYLLVFFRNLIPGITNIWPHDLPLALEVILVILLSDFLRYWLHRFCHTFPFLWRFHAVHHSVQKLYWLNTSRFHPIEKSLQFAFDVLPFMLLGVSEEVIALHFVLYAVNGSFQHCNITLKYGYLNYLVSSSEHHRWHHSRIADESNNNYGNNVIIWDLLFGTYFLPHNREVAELGLPNKNYPSGFIKQLKTPFIKDIEMRDKPVLPLKDVLLNLLLRMKMLYVKYKYYRPFIKMTEDPRKAQLNLLNEILTKNKNTVYGREHKFNEVTDYASYRQNVPLCDYEKLRPYIEKQDKEKKPYLSAEQPVMFNQTSGTTDKPKYIPVLKSGLKQFTRTQQIFTYLQYKKAPEGYTGKILGIAGPAVEGYLETGTPYGSASGQLLKSMPALARLKYAVPYEVFEIHDYQIKYYTIARLAISEKNITYIASGNPSTFHKLLEVINKNLVELITEVKTGRFKYMDQLDESKKEAISRYISPDTDRAAELEELYSLKQELSYDDIWPHLKILATWTGGSCGISLKSILNRFPKDINCVDLGYISSESRGTINIDIEDNVCIPILHEVFYEFVEQSDYENGNNNFRLLDELVSGNNYYVFITTKAGLYRYDMNDILKAGNYIGKTPSLSFIQKGKGVCNITGEKLYESQLIEAMNIIERTNKKHFDFYILLANEEDSRYELYYQINSSIIATELAEMLDKKLCDLNIEYETKRMSSRLKDIKAIPLKSGSYDKIKESFLEKGRKESQFKLTLIQYKNKFPVNLNQYADKID